MVVTCLDVLVKLDRHSALPQSAIGGRSYSEEATSPVWKPVRDKHAGKKSERRNAYDSRLKGKK
jgi:hypothetical protein